MSKKEEITLTLFEVVHRLVNENIEDLGNVDESGNGGGRYGEFFCLLSSQFPYFTETALKVEGEG